jgi:hypothetical protein
VVFLHPYPILLRETVTVIYVQLSIDLLFAAYRATMILLSEARIPLGNGGPVLLKQHPFCGATLLLFCDGLSQP